MPVGAESAAECRPSPPLCRDWAPPEMMQALGHTDARLTLRTYARTPLATPTNKAPPRIRPGPILGAAAGPVPVKAARSGPLRC